MTLTMDVAVITANGFTEHQQFENIIAGFTALRRWLKNKDFFAEKKSLFCLEHTGLYTRQLAAFIMQWACSVWVESALHLKRSVGTSRGNATKYICLSHC